jgi:hypothetical protein
MAQMTTAVRLRIVAPCIFLATLTLANLAVLWFGLYRILPIALVAMTVLILAMYRPVAPASLMRLAPAGLALLAVYLYTGAATLWAPNPGDALSIFSVVILAMIPALLFGYALGSRFTIQEISVAFGIVPVIFLLQTGYNLFAGGDAMLISEYSIRSLLGGVTCLTTPLLLASYLQRARVLVGFSFVISLILALSIQSRSSVIITVPAMLYVMHGYSKKAFLSTLLGALLVSLAVVAVNTDQILKRFAPESTNLNISESVLEELAKPVEDRVDFDRRLQAFVATTLFLQNPLAGGGYSSVLQRTELDYGVAISSHGFVPGTLGELGLFGLGVILFFFYRLYRLANVVKKHSSKSAPIASKGFFCCLASLVFYGFFHQTFESATFGVAAGIALGMMATASQSPRPASTP